MGIEVWREKECKQSAIRCIEEARGVYSSNRDERGGSE